MMYKKICKYINNIEQKIYAEKNAILLVFTSVFFWGLLAHIYGFLHCSLSHDVLNAFVATPTEETWKIELGRYFVPLYRTIFRGTITLPWLIGILGLTWTAIAVFMIIKIFCVSSKLLIFLIAGIMTTNLTYIAQIATYIYEFDFNAFSLMLSILAVYLWEKDKNKLSLLLSGLCLMFSMGIYQAYFSVSITLIILKSILNLFDKQDTKKVFIHGLKGIFILLLGGILYLLAGKLIYAVTGIVGQERTDIFSLDVDSPILFYIALIPDAFLLLLSKIFHVIYSFSFRTMAYIVTFILSISVICVFVRKKYEIIRILFICVLTGLIPFAMTCVYFLARGKGFHDLMIYSFWLFYVFLLLLSFKLCDDALLPELPSKFIRLSSCVLIFFFLWQNVITANTAYVKKENEANATLSTMTRVVTTMEQQADYKFGDTTIAFIGITNMGEDIYGNVETIMGLTKKTSIPKDNATYYYNAYKAYFKYVLQYPIQFCTDEEWLELKNDSKVKEMPTYPQDGYIKMIDDILVIKMS